MRNNVYQVLTYQTHEHSKYMDHDLKLKGSWTKDKKEYLKSLKPATLFSKKELKEYLNSKGHYYRIIKKWNLD